MRFLNTLIAAIVALIIVLFAVSNRQIVAVEVWPFPFRIEAGLYLIILLAVLLGFAAGAIGLWLAGAEKRRELRSMRRRSRELETSLARMKEDVAAARAKAELSPAKKT